MGLFRKTLLATATVLAASALTGVAAQANPIYVGYSLDGMSITQVGSGPDGFNAFSATAGGFTISGTGTGAPTTDQGTLLSNSTSVSSNTAGTIYILVSETGNTLNAATFTTGFGNNSLSTTTIRELSYASAGSAPFSSDHLLSFSDVAPGSSMGTDTVAAPAGLGSSYTLTVMYAITYGATGGRTTATLNVQGTPTSVPEPTSMALLGAGLIGVGVVRRRRAQ